jgi:hypothetical protein
MNFKYPYSLLIILGSLITTLDFTFAQATENRSIELGKVNWIRSYDKAVEKSISTNKPILILFQEVPGCSTCQNYGSNVLSHPLIVDAIENEFVPLAIFNNKNGEDRRILKKFNEPSWNNPVIRIVDNHGKDIIHRIAGLYTKEALVLNMTIALTVSNRSVPVYLKLLDEEFVRNKSNIKTEYFSMYCFWSGEAFFGNQKGILSTEPGFMNGKEVVKVQFDNSKTKLPILVEKAKSENISYEQKSSKFRKDKDPQYYIKNSKYKHIPLTRLQKTKINAALKSDGNPDKYLSPTQKEFLAQSISKTAILYDKDISASWELMITQMK